MVAPVGVFKPSPLVAPFLEIAAAFGVRRIVLLSAAIIDEDGPVFGKLHHAVRRYVPEWTVLKPSYFLQNLTISMALRFGRKMKSSRRQDRQSRVYRCRRYC
ncbi:hypothetical protein ABE057_15350 [Bacillus paralicheniformis]|uniref:hypothetical protein n=1 Tax=Bacillus paralicheniformis TaxID=1648923 RepID=UPI00362E2B37